MHCQVAQSQKEGQEDRDLKILSEGHPGAPREKEKKPNGERNRNEWKGTRMEINKS